MSLLDNISTVAAHDTGLVLDRMLREAGAHGTDFPSLAMHQLAEALGCEPHRLYAFRRFATRVSRTEIGQHPAFTLREWLLISLPASHYRQHLVEWLAGLIRISPHFPPLQRYQQLEHEYRRIAPAVAEDIFEGLPPAAL